MHLGTTVKHQNFELFHHRSISKLQAQRAKPGAPLLNLYHCQYGILIGTTQYDNLHLNVKSESVFRVNIYVVSFDFQQRVALGCVPGS